MEKRTPYFSHDINAHDDQKIQTLITLYRFQGYGWFWYLLEMMGIEENYKLEESDYFYCTLARRFLTTEKFAKKFIDDCIKIKLFERSEGYLYSSSFLDRMRLRDSKVLKCRESGSIGGKVSSERSSERKANAQPIKLNEIKLKKEEKEYKEKELQFDFAEKEKTLDFVWLKPAEKEKLIQDFGSQAYNDLVERLDGWMTNHPDKRPDGKEQYFDHYKTIRNWMKKEPVKNKPKILTATYDPNREEA